MTSVVGDVAMVSCWRDPARRCLSRPRGLRPRESSPRGDTMRSRPLLVVCMIVWTGCASSSHGPTADAGSDATNDAGSVGQDARTDAADGGCSCVTTTEAPSLCSPGEISPRPCSPACPSDSVCSLAVGADSGTTPSCVPLAMGAFQGCSPTDCSCLVENGQSSQCKCQQCPGQPPVVTCLIF